MKWVVGTLLKQSVNRPASQPPASYCLPLQFFSCPRAPEMQRQPRRAAVAGMCPGTQRSVCQRKKPGGDFHPIGRCCWQSRQRAGLRQEPRDGPLCASTERTLCCHDYRVLSPIGPKHPSIPAQGGVAKNKGGQTVRPDKGKAAEQKNKKCKI